MLLIQQLRNIPKIVLILIQQIRIVYTNTKTNQRPHHRRTDLHRRCRSHRRSQNCHFRWSHCSPSWRCPRHQSGLTGSRASHRSWLGGSFPPPSDKKSSVEEESPSSLSSSFLLYFFSAVDSSSSSRSSSAYLRLLSLEAIVFFFSIIVRDSCDYEVKAISGSYGVVGVHSKRCMTVQ
jgi:hypothetical protein